MSSTLDQRRCRKKPVMEIEDECFAEEGQQDASTGLIETPKNILIDFQDHMERYCNVLPVFGSNSAKNDINLIKSCWLLFFVNERVIEPIMIKKSAQFVSLNFGNVQLLHILNFLGGAMGLDSFLKALKNSETKIYSPYEWFNIPEKQQNSISSL